jgi:hypothetical protein
MKPALVVFVVAWVAACSTRTAPAVDGSASDQGSAVANPDVVTGRPCQYDCECAGLYCVDRVCSSTSGRSGPGRGVCNPGGTGLASAEITCACQGGTCRAAGGLGGCCYLPDGGIADPEGPTCKVPCQADCQCGGIYICADGYCRPDLNDLTPQGFCGALASDGGPAQCPCTQGQCVDLCCKLPDGSIGCE